MGDEGLLTTDPHMPQQRLDDPTMTGASRNDGGPQMVQGGGLNTFVNSEELRITATSAVAENEQLKGQLMSIVNSMQQKMQEVENMKLVNRRLTDELVKRHEMSKITVLALQNKITHLHEYNQRLTREIAVHQKQKGSGDGTQEPKHVIVDALKSHMHVVEKILRQELSSLNDEDRANDIIDKLMGHIQKAEDILNIPDVELYGGACKANHEQDMRDEAGTPRATPSSPTDQQSYNQHVQTMFTQLHALKKEVDEKNSALTLEREHGESLERQLQQMQQDLVALRGRKESDVAAAMERQRKEDDVKHQHEMKEMMAKLDELTALAADKHQKHAFDEEPRYHSASNELKQQVTSLVAELEHKERCLNDEKDRLLQQIHMNEALQIKMSTYHEELKKARREAQSYVDTLHAELKRKDTLFQAQRQMAMHEKLQHDKYKDDLAALQDRFKHLEIERSKLYGDTRVLQEKEDRHLAELLSAEEAIEAKEMERKKFEKQLAQVKSELHIWKTQTEVCKRDFEEERGAREKMHTENQTLHDKIDELRREKKNLEEELQYFHRQQLQARFLSEYGQYERGGEVDLYAPRRQVYDVRGDDESGVVEAIPPYQRQRQFVKQELRQPQQATAANWCPKCEQTFPDYDTLTIHIADCID